MSSKLLSPRLHGIVSRRLSRILSVVAVWVYTCVFVTPARMNAQELCVYGDGGVLLSLKSTYVLPYRVQTPDAPFLFRADRVTSCFTLMTGLAIERWEVVPGWGWFRTYPFSDRPSEYLGPVRDISGVAFLMFGARLWTRSGSLVSPEGTLLGSMHCTEWLGTFEFAAPVGIDAYPLSALEMPVAVVVGRGHTDFTAAPGLSPGWSVKVTDNWVFGGVLRPSLCFLGFICVGADLNLVLVDWGSHITVTGPQGVRDLGYPVLGLHAASLRLGVRLPLSSCICGG
jgi:hypothetical protein